MELSPETCRVKPFGRINAIVASCWNYFTIKHDARNHKYYVIFKFIISVTDGYCDYSPRESKNLATPLGRGGEGEQEISI